MHHSRLVGPASVITPVVFFLGNTVAVGQDIQKQIKQLPEISPVLYKVDPYIRAAAALQRLPKDKAIEVTMAVAQGKEHEHQIIVLCRMLFTAKPGREFRNPRVGAGHYLNETEAEQWPLSPIELVDGVPFLISMGYHGSGIRESAAAYLRYCIENCNWNAYKFSPKNEREKKQALERLFASPKWKGPFDEPESDFLESQIK